MVSVSIIMGSDSDMPVMSQAAEVLEELSIEFEIRILSAHRQTRELIDYLEKARERGIKVIIAGRTSRHLCLSLSSPGDRNSHEDI